MTFDLEALMDGSADTKPSLHSPIDPPPQVPETSMALVRTQLTRLLMPEDAGKDMLTTQMAKMDVIFNHMLRDFANCPREATSLIQAKRLALALKLQQNCAHTARSIRAMRYMATLEESVKRQSSAPTPPPPPPVRANELGWVKMTAKSTGWTKEKRARVAKRTKNQQPWIHSTGPKTKEGKAISAQNAYQHGFFSEDYRAVMALLNTHAAFVTSLNQDRVEE